jgi:hypothetical protein
VTPYGHSCALLNNRRRPTFNRCGTFSRLPVRAAEKKKSSTSYFCCSHLPPLLFLVNSLNVSLRPLCCMCACAYVLLVEFRRRKGHPEALPIKTEKEKTSLITSRSLVRSFPYCHYCPPLLLFRGTSEGNSSAHSASFPRPLAVVARPFYKRRTHVHRSEGGSTTWRTQCVVAHCTSWGRRRWCGR